jgi:hypothetical protein
MHKLEMDKLSKQEVEWRNKSFRGNNDVAKYIYSEMGWKSRKSCYIKNETGSKPNGSCTSMLHRSILDPRIWLWRWYFKRTILQNTFVIMSQIVSYLVGTQLQAADLTMGLCIDNIVSVPPYPLRQQMMNGSYGSCMPMQPIAETLSSSQQATAVGQMVNHTDRSVGSNDGDTANIQQQQYIYQQQQPASNFAVTQNLANKEEPSVSNFQN